MANRFPLQDGDQSSDLSRTDSSQAGDRRPDSVSPPSNKGSNGAPQSGTPIYPLFRAGYVEQTRHTPPFDSIEMQGDTSGDGTVIHEIDTRSYGDGYDPTAPIRVRIAPWSLDSDGDGHLN